MFNETGAVNYIESNVRLSINFVLFINYNSILLDIYKFFIFQLQMQRYDTKTINQLFRLLYNPSGPDKLDYLMDSTNMEEVSNETCRGGTRWTIVTNEHTHFPSKDLQ